MLFHNQENHIHYNNLYFAGDLIERIGEDYNNNKFIMTHLVSFGWAYIKIIVITLLKTKTMEVHMPPRSGLEWFIKLLHGYL